MINEKIREKLIEFCSGYSNRVEQEVEFNEVEKGARIVAVYDKNVGVATRNPSDEDIFEVGEALAIARMKKDKETEKKIMCMINDMYHLKPIETTTTMVTPARKSKKKAYAIEIKETLSRILAIEAKSVKKAIEKAERMYMDEDIVLDYDDFTGTKIRRIK